MFALKELKACAGLEKGFGEMIRRAPLPKITECVEKERVAKSLPGRRFARMVYPFVVMCVLGLAHIHLQFERTDMLMQQGQLQLKQRQLVREQSFLTREIERLCKPENLKTRGIFELHMEETGESRQGMVAMVPATVQRKYTAEGKVSKDEMVVAEIRQSRQGESLPSKLLSLVESGQARAAEAK